MDIMELGAIGELVGGAAVLVTLIYLAVQVQMTRASIKATAELDAARSYEAIIRDATDHGHWVMSPGNVPIFEKGLWVEILPRRDLLQGLQHGRVGDRHLVHAIELRLDGELRARDVGFRTVADLPRQVDERRHHSDRPAHFAHRSDCFPVHDPMSPAAGSHAETADRILNQWLSVQVAYDHGSVDPTYFKNMKEDVVRGCEKWPGLDRELREGLSNYSTRWEVFESIYDQAAS